MLSLAIGNGALQSEDDLFGGLGLLSEDGLGLTSVSILLAVVTTFALSLQRVCPSCIASLCGPCASCTWPGHRKCD